MLALLVAVEIAGWSAGAVRVPSSPQAWGGIRDGKGPVRVADYNLEAVLDPVKHTVEGRERLIWRNRSAESISALYLHLYLNAFEGQASDFYLERKVLGGFRTDVAVRKGEYGYIELRHVSQGGKPVPWRFVVKYGSKILVRKSSAIPHGGAPRPAAAGPARRLGGPRHRLP